MRVSSKDTLILEKHEGVSAWKCRPFGGRLAPLPSHEALNPRCVKLSNNESKILSNSAADRGTIFERVFRRK